MGSNQGETMKTNTFNYVLCILFGGFVGSFRVQLTAFLTAASQKLFDYLRSKLHLSAAALILCVIPMHAQAAGAHSATLNWTASSAPGVTYAVRRGTTQGGAKSVIATGVTAVTYIDSGLAANQAVCYDVIAQMPGVPDSAPTNDWCGTTPKDTPTSLGAPSNLTGTTK